MSELVQQQSARPKGEINTRKADAGLIKLRNPGMSMFQALQQAGFSESTARNPRLNGLGEKQCIAEAWRRLPQGKPRELLRKTRQLFNSKLDTALANLDQHSLSEVSRIANLAEGNYGTGAEPDMHESDARSFADRLQFVVELTRELAKRELDSTKVELGQADVIDVEAEVETDIEQQPT